MMWSGFPYPQHPKKELKTMRKRNFIKSFLYYSAIIAIPILTVFLVFLAFVFQGKQREIREDAETAAQAVRDNYSLVLDSAATQYDILARNPRLSISLRGFISHKQIGYLDVILTNTILSNFNSLTNNAPYIASVYYYLDGYDSILTSDTGKRVEVLIAATPLSQAVHCRIRYTAVTVAFLVVTAVPVVYAVGFYGIIFGAIDWNTLLLPLVITVFPPFLLVMGTGLWLGRVHHRLLMALVAVVLLLAVVPVPSDGPLWRNFLFLLIRIPLGLPGPALSAAGLCDRRKSDGLCLGSGVRCRRGPVKRVSEQDSRRCPARCETRNFNQWPEGVPRCSAFPGFENREQE